MSRKILFFAFIIFISILSLMVITTCNQNPFVGVGEEVDQQAPSVKITEPISGSYVTETFSLRGTCSDNVKVTSVKIILKDTSKSWSASISGGKSWHKSFSSSDGIGTGEKTFEVFVYDKAKNYSLTQTYLVIDNDIPTITILSPTLKADSDFSGLSENEFAHLQYFTNQTLSIKGEITDEAPIDVVTIKLYDGGLLKYSNSIVRGVDLSSDVAGNTKNFIFNIDTTTLTDNIVYLVNINAVDSAGNKISQDKGYIKVLQSTDEPKSKISTPDGSGNINPSSKATGESFDDDGLDTVYYFVGKTIIDFGGGLGDPTPDFTQWGDHTSDNHVAGHFDLSTNNPKQSGWGFKLPAGSGGYKMHIIGIDENSVPTYPEGTPTTLLINLQVPDAPELTITGPEAIYTYKDIIQVDVDAKGGTGKDVSKILYRIESNLPADSGWLAISDASGDFVAANNVLTNFTFDSTLYVNDATTSVHDIKVSIICENNSAEQSNIQATYLKADNTAPDIAITSPATDAEINGLWPISGTWSDDWAGVKAIYIGYFPSMGDTTMDTAYDTEAELETDTAGIPTINKWYKISNPTAAWSYDFDTTIITLAQVNPYSLYVAAVDDSGSDVGNNGNVSYTSRNFNLNQSSDNPTTTIITPSAAAVLLPSSTASGNCNDDDGLDYIYWFIGRTDIDWGNGLGEPTADHAQWGTYSALDSAAGVIDVSGTNPKVYSWQMTTPSGVGNYRVHILPVDMNSLAAALKETVDYQQKETDMPSISITGPSVANTYNGDVTIDVTASGGSIDLVTNIYYKLESTVLTDPTWTETVGFASSNSVNHSFSVNLDNYVSSTIHDVTIKVYARNDILKDSLEASITLKGDKTAPIVAITDPTVDTGINGTWTISGTLSDDWAGVKALYISYFPSMGDTTMDNDYDTENELEAQTLGSPTINKWYKITSPSSAWNYNFDTAVITAGKIDPYSFYVAAVDNVSNVSYTSITYNLDQALDNPTATIFAPTSGASIIPGSSATGVANDDDGLDYVYWFIGKTTIDFGGGVGEPTADHTQWGTYSAVNSAAGVIDLTATNPTFYPWAVTTPSGIGDYRVHIMSVDENALNAVSKETVDYKQKETDVPSISITGPSVSNTYNGDVTIDVSANGGSIDNVTNIYYKIESTVLTDPTWTETIGFVVGNNVTHSFQINLDNYVSATVHDVTIKVYARNNIPKDSLEASITLKGDKTAPIVAITDPTTDYGINGIWTISGTISDDWAGVKATYICYFASMNNTIMDNTYDTEAELEADTVGSPTLEKWIKVSSPSAAWNYSYDTTVITSGQVNPYSFYVASVDNVGNVSYTSRDFDVNQNLDKPTATISVPTSGGTTLPQTTASGNAEDDDGLNYVYWFVGKTSINHGGGLGDPTADPTTWGTYSQADAAAGIIDISGTNPKIYTWQFTSPNGSGEYKIHIRPRDKNNVWADSNTTVTYNQQSSSAPTIQITGPDPSDTYSGTIPIDVHADGAGKNVIEIWYDVSSDLFRSGWTKKSDASGDFVAALTVNYQFSFDSIPYVDASVHSILVRVKCVNVDSDESQVMSTNLLADNNAPTVAISSPAAASTINGIIQLQGTASDWSTVKAIYYGYYSAMTDVNMINNYNTEAKLEADTLGTPTIEKWYKVTSPSPSWFYSYETEILTSGAIPSYNLYVAAVDNVGNVSYTKRNYAIDQAVDKPIVTITNPSYSGSTTTPWLDVVQMDKFASSFLITGEASDDDGIDWVKIDLYLMDYTGGGHSINTTKEASTDVIGTYNWSYSLSDLSSCASNQYYMIIPYIRDINAREEQGTPSFFIVSNQTPLVEILWPTKEDPDNDTRFYSGEGKRIIDDALGAVISNEMDDLYWDNNNKNNHMYLSDSPKFFFGWDNDQTDDDGDNSGYPDINEGGAVDYSIYCTDFNESSIGSPPVSIFDGDANGDDERTTYFRMIFKAKDDGKITKVELSLDGGSTWDTMFSGDPLVNQDTNLYAKVDDQMGDGFTWFYANVDTTALGTSEILVVKVTDDNNPTPYFFIDTIQVTSENNAPTGSIDDWGTINDQTIISSSAPYVGGTATDIDSGIRYAKIYIWDNEGSINVPDYGNGLAGNLTANVSSGTYTVDITDIEDIDAASDNFADYMVKADMYTAVDWRIQDIYSEISPTDGIKLICLEVIDNAGNTAYYFEEVYFSEYPPSITAVNLWWNKMNIGDKISAPGDETTDRLWISGTDVGSNEGLEMDGSVQDDPGSDPGINRIRVIIRSDDNSDDYAIWSTESDGNVEITPAPALPYNGSGSVSWTLSGQDTSGDVNSMDGNYLMLIEVQDKAGVVYTQKQYIYIDNTPATLTVDDPVEGIGATGRYNINGTASDGGGLEDNCVLIEIYNISAPTGTSWTVTPAAGNWDQWWDTTSPANFDEVIVTLTDKAKNETVISRNIFEDGNVPDFVTFELWDVDGTADVLTFSSFTDLYTALIGNAVYLTKKDITIDSSVDDDNEITNSGIYLSAELQSDGSTSNEPFQAFVPNIDTVGPPNYIVGGGSSYLYSDLTSGEYTYKVWIDQQNGAIDVNLTKKFIVDSQLPHIWIENMQYTDYVENGGTKYGHIDVELNSNGESDNDDDVSGTIFIDLKAFDNYILDQIQVKCTGIDFGNGINTWTTIADRNNNTGVWAEMTNGSLGDKDYWKTIKNSETLTANNNLYSITFEFNTANLYTIAGLNKNLEFRVVDMAGNMVNDTTPSSEVDTDPSISAASPNATYQQIVRKKIDIVPYISSLDTGIGGPTLSYVSRSALGKYPVNYDVGVTDLITINGFNLNPGASDVTIDSFAATIDSTDDTGGFTWIKIRKNSTQSGYLAVWTNSIRSTNNDNSNDQATNQEAKTYFPDINDDRYIAMWQQDSHVSWTGKIDAVMKPNVARTDMKWMFVSNYQEVYIDNQKLAYAPTLKGGDFGFNDVGTFMYIFNFDAEIYSALTTDDWSQYGSIHWGKDEDLQEEGSGSCENWQKLNTDRLGVGNLSFNGDSEYSYDKKIIGRYKNLKIFADGNDTETNVYVAYYDSGSESQGIIFWSFEAGSGLAAPDQVTDLADGWTSNIEKIANKYTNYNRNSNPDTGIKTPYDAATGVYRIEVTDNSEDSEHFDMQYDSINDNMYIAYYDGLNSLLKFAYNTNPDISGDTWTIRSTAIDSSAGPHVRMAVDPDGGIHLAYYDIVYGNLKYAYLPSYDCLDGNIKVATVDGLFTNGMYNSIAIKDFDDTAGTDYRPIISSYALSLGETKYAVRVSWPLYNPSNASFGDGATASTGDYTSKWEVITVCSSMNTSQERTFIETDSATQYEGQLVVGYNGTYIEEATLLD